MPGWASTLLGVVVGAVLAYGASVMLERKRRASDARAGRRTALAVFLGRLYILVGWMSQWPEELPPSVIERVRAQTIEKSARIRMNDWVTTQRRLREVLGENLYDPLHRFTEAVAVIQLIELDPRVRSAINEAVDYIERLTKHRDEATLEAWPPLRRRLLDAIAASGDAPVIDAAEPSETIHETDPISAAVAATD